MATRKDLLTQVAHRLNKNPPPSMDPMTETRLASYLNGRQRRLLTMPGLQRLRDATITFDSIAGHADIGIPGIAKLNRLFERTNDSVLYEIGASDYRLWDPNPQSGTPEAYVWRGRQVVQQQPAQPSSLWLQSSAAADTNVAVTITGLLSNNTVASLQVTLTGTTPIQVGATVDWVRVDKFSHSGSAGSVWLTEGSGTGTFLGAIAPGQTTAYYDGLTLWPTPSTVTRYYADVTRLITDMVFEGDRSLLPDDFADLLVLGTLADEYQHLADPRWSTVMTEYQMRENQLKYWLAETAMGRPFGLTRAGEPSSRLGAWFPAGS